ncbi:hypothetical protein SEA_BIPPER_2 [Mycobacterium phage Bipper]|uniref:Uncharacterized protein n=1 Tax=Mycobacterium phage Bipper TaxID=1805457 RepID=A0A142F2D1_9CAUD|nr:hypothetical protein KCH39_gp002 [Mycobacterium phage Bipper]AMQ66938.1 hypothetical protein SEA_BIPPER_2 [Mycobacterium phage Bipper]
MTYTRAEVIAQAEPIGWCGSTGYVAALIIRLAIVTGVVFL